jgi:hypothetical protein
MTLNGLLLHSIAEFREVIFACLSAAQVSSVVEIGMGQGEFTRELAAWMSQQKGRLVCIDTCPPPSICNLITTMPFIDLRSGRSCDVLPTLPPADAYIVDGDHNYYTVSAELRAIRASHQHTTNFPVVFVHDVSGPWARQDSYFDPQALPEGAIHPYRPASAMIMAAELEFGEEGRRRLMGSGYSAIAEGGPANGVLTAVEDFIAETPAVECRIIPCIFGLGVVFDKNAAFARKLDRLLNPLTNHPLLARMERNRLELFEAYVTWRLRATS